MLTGQRPPLACRPSPPLGGRSDVTPVFANHQRCKTGGAPKQPISPLVGEMSGRTEGGAKERDLAIEARANSPTPARRHTLS
ncbi:MAG: hypothetical protein EOS58_31965 [Mesorhizobium sp.]|nr:hypothetical protein EOA33_09370 [Mesorhizobium sp. M4A.F.Ca.ET.050.02.1.1]RVC40883.1 hypothetical protein EN781_28130 [Mesorhizobium sp. M4A.F.Ca.ET.090.04.2.1]RVC75946.1 hypothetical protein EN745_26110 [Mesorhizobium sp. M4A.F.Ca.ET.022.05.2.1]RWC99686.1 MAG: hypothetical protein EOS58_31965 [Mesorhizobium sp.]RWD09729.1 MAG: hypothetical protein EOS74_30980 [Mesorhizobium sp.]